MLKIKNWYGRLGNNIMQVCHAIQYGIKNNHSIIEVPKHEFIQTSDLCRPMNKEKYEDLFFGQHCHDLRDIEFDRKLLKSFIKKDKLKVKKLEADELVIHVRSGDVYSTNPHPFWLQPPLEFYRQVISERDWSVIYLICEDTNSPVLKPLLEEFSNIRFQVQPLSQDISYVLGAKNICFGFGSFIPSLLMLNDNVENVYYPTYCYRYPLNLMKVKHHKWSLRAYIENGTWYNTPQQRFEMVNFKRVFKEK